MPSSSRTRSGSTDDAQLRALEAASLLHDVGKLAVPDHILNKPSTLTPTEFENMKRHANVGADILAAIGFPYPVVPIVRHHHESWDGTGYPAGLAAEEIPIGARILSVVDCFDALTSDRPYRTRLSREEAIRVVQSRSGTMYDPRVVSTFVTMLESSPPVVELPSTRPPHGLSRHRRHGASRHAAIAAQTRRRRDLRDALRARRPGGDGVERGRGPVTHPCDPP